MVDILAWFVIHMGISALMTRVPGRYFSQRICLFQPFSWETRNFYEQKIQVKKWKDQLPDAAPWFGGFSKKSLADRSTSYLTTYMQETCRGEAAHMLIIALSPLFFLWNEVWVGWFMIAFGLTFNAPCWLVQRYNRGRLLRLGDK